jgi:hypothetical protein
MADERAEQAVQTLYNMALKKQAVEEALLVIASFGAMQFLPDLVRAIDNDWLRFEDSPPDPPMSFAVAHSTVTRMLDHVGLDERYLTASASMRGKLDKAVLEARASLEFVGSIPALATAAAAHGDRHKSKTSAAWVPFRAAMRFASFEPALSQLMSAITPIVIQSARTHQPRRAVVRRSARLGAAVVADPARRAARRASPPPPSVRRRVPGHRPGAVRRHLRAHHRQRRIVVVRSR